MQDKIEGVIRFLQEHELVLATAESCTAGLVTSLLADIPGCGSVLECGYVVYTGQAKSACLGVDPVTIHTFGLTSEEVAREMAQGALRRTRANLTVAVTGTAESDDELNGVVCFAFALTGSKTQPVTSETLAFTGGRNNVRKAAALHAILSLPSRYQQLCAADSRVGVVNGPRAAPV